MIVAHEVQDAVQNKPANLPRGGVPGGTGVASRRLGGDHDVAQKTGELAARWAGEPNAPRRLARLWPQGPALRYSRMAGPAWRPVRRPRKGQHIGGLRPRPM